MLLTISTTTEPATELGFLLHKHPDRAQTVDTSAGLAHVFYPEATRLRCTAALLLEVDPVALVRRYRHPAGDGSGSGYLGQYVNDRPYAASSMLAVALGRAFRTAMRGRCDARPDLVARPLPLDLHLPALPCRGGAELARRLFEPIGWTVLAAAVPTDPRMPGWGDSRYLDLRLSGRLRLADALNHLYLLMPVLDDAKHYWVSIDEVDKLVRAGTGWLANHPERDLISRRYLAHRRGLTRAALARLAEVDDTDPDVLDDAVDEPGTGLSGPTAPPAPPAPPGPPGPPGPPEAEERPIPLAERRRAAVLAVLRGSGAARVGDLGCGDGSLLAALLAEPEFTEVVGVDVSFRALELAARRLRLDRMPDRWRDRLQLFQTSLTYRDKRLAGLDAVVLMEVVEHLDPPRLPALERSVFGAAAPGTVVVTTPNVEYNVRFPGLPAGARRHRDHRFEWTRAQFTDWTGKVGADHGYSVRLCPVGAEDPEVGPPTQMAVFTRAAPAAGAGPQAAPHRSERS
ncbi:MAG TPA: 3' terminal RNA ribose 2'-O-methyltransferase Hen1 [Mycobacteriales bacterium]|nr:3' terminal RNA ribose 2'-O-methyltransferase Hen1 [Mycobacteriales bacterium]